MHVLVCTDHDGHCGQGLCVIAVSEDKYRLEDLIEEKKANESYRYCKFRIYDGIEIITRESDKHRNGGDHTGHTCCGAKDTSSDS